TCQVTGHGVDIFGELLPDATHTLDLSLAAELAFGAYFVGDPGHLAGKCVELVDHDVDRVFELKDLTLDVHGDLLGQVAIGDRGGDLGDVSNLACEVAGHEVDVVGEVLPHATDAAHLGLAAQLALSAHLARDAGHLGAERTQLI